ncbi:hypothetical protein GUJ93_ZPchr0001g29424 [Zizania palustris]|uniref:Uncharacterized protein n=1 Tax=Zizania palustris TaxID=103762 RepID=A0A8J5RRW4_ZIZPA|nr:hypothetical protein GUJ93_ZPchr0001g29424 [Zizania palustris]
MPEFDSVVSFPYKPDNNKIRLGEDQNESHSQSAKGSESGMNKNDEGDNSLSDKEHDNSSNSEQTKETPMEDNEGDAGKEGKVDILEFGDGLSDDDDDRGSDGGARLVDMSIDVVGQEHKNEIAGKGQLVVFADEGKNVSEAGSTWDGIALDMVDQHMVIPTDSPNIWLIDCEHP